MRRYDANGALLQEDAYENERRVRLRQFARDGSLRSEEHLNRAAQRHGARLVRYVDDDRSPYLNAQVIEERSHFEQGQPAFAAEFVTTLGETLRVERGHVFDDDQCDHPVFTEDAHDCNAWLALAQELGEARRVRHALIAAARASARANSAEPLRAWLATRVLPLLSERARELSSELLREESLSVSAVLSALLLGAEPATALRALAKLLPNRAHASHDLVEAALLLSPDESDAYSARAITWLELGKPEKAFADAERVAHESEALAAFIRIYTHLMFPKWRFVPAEEKLSASFEGLSETPVQPLASIRRTIEVYATRLHHLRQSAIARAQSDTGSWLPPALPNILRGGPVDLLRYRATLVDEGEEDGSAECSEVEIDEAMELSQVSLMKIQARARCDWAALTWLCWAAGLDRVELPEQLEARSDFAAAASCVIARAARAEDALATGGIRARAQGLPGFDWEGFPIDELAPPLAQLACNEYAELRTLFLWLCFSENRSPFQSDLRAQ
jgi:hypothetical protein